jgi:hypothetical protein
VARRRTVTFKDWWKTNKTNIFRDYGQGFIQSVEEERTAWTIWSAALESNNPWKPIESAPREENVRNKMTFDQWFDTTYGDMFEEGKNVVLLLTYKEVAQRAWDKALESQQQPDRKIK